MYTITNLEPTFNRNTSKAFPSASPQRFSPAHLPGRHTARTAFDTDAARLEDLVYVLLSNLLNAESVFRVMWVSSHISRAMVRVHVHEGVVGVTPPDTTILRVLHLGEGRVLAVS